MAKARKKKAGKKAPGLTPEQVIERRLHSLTNREDVASFFQRLTAMAVLLWVIFGVLFGITPMKNDDMMPRISAGDLMLYYRFEQNLHTQDVIVFEKDGVSCVGRVIAQDGDTVEVTEEASLVINGSTILENDIYYSTPRYDSSVVYPVALNADEVFVLCDYREGAKDSRYFGAVNKKEIKGKVITVIRRSGL